MKLKTFNAYNMQKGAKNFRPFITLNIKSGVITVNRGAAELMGIKQGDGVQLHQDEDDPESWYIEKTKNGGFNLRHNKSKTTLMFNNCSLVREIFQSMEYHANKTKISIGEEITVGKQTIFTLITAPLKNSDNQ